MHIKIIFILFLVYINLTADDVDNKYDEKALLESIFGKKATSDIENFSVPVIINGHGFITVKINIKNDEVFLKKDDIKKILNITTIKYKDKISNNKELIPINSLLKYDIKVKYDKKNLAVDINIPPKYFKLNTIMFNILKDKKSNKDIVTASKYSGVFNFYIQQNFSDTNTEDMKKKDLNIRNNFFININDYIINGSLNYQENRDPNFRRGRVFIEKDDISSNIRYKFGEIYLPSNLRLTGSDVFGFSSSTILKLFKINHKNSIRINQYEFFIENDSLVKLYINDVYKRSMNLRAGTHNFYDLYIPQGLNKVKLEIQDKYGQTDTMVFDDYKYNEILSKGTLLYGYGFGIKRYEEDETIKFDKDKYVASSVIKYGLTDDLTIQTGVKLSNDDISYAYDLYYGTKLGKINQYYTNNTISYEHIVNPYKQNIKEKGIEFSTKISKINLNLYRKNRLVFKDDILTDEVDTSYMGLSTQLTDLINLNINYTIQDSFINKDKTLNLGIDYNINNNLSLDINYYKKHTSDNSDNDSINFLLVYKFGKTSYSIDRRYDYYNNEDNNDIKTTQSIKYNSKGDTDLSISAYNTESIQQRSSQDISVGLDDLKYKLYARYSNDSSQKDHLNISLQSAIAFAKDKMTFSKPINNSFIILSNNSAFEKNIVGIKNYPIRKIFAITNSDYYTKKIDLDESSLMKNYSLENSTLYVKSNYKSGNLVDIDLPVKYSVKGTLYNDKNKTIPYGAFNVLNINTDESYLTFTNEKGIFYLENLKPSDYEGSYINSTKEDINKTFKFTVDDVIRKNIQIDLGDKIVSDTHFNPNQ